MSKVTSKFQVTVPRAIAAKYGIHPGDEIEWVPAGDGIRVLPAALVPKPLTREARLELFDQATERHRKRAVKTEPAASRGWKREDLYTRGRPR